MTGLVTVICLVVAAGGLLAWLFLTTRPSVASAEPEVDASAGQTRPQNETATSGGTMRSVLGRLASLWSDGSSRIAILSFVLGAALASGAAYGVFLLQDREDSSASAVSGNRPGEQAGHAGLDDMVAKLAQRLDSNPEDAEGWALLARTLVRLEKYRDALNPYAEAIARASSDSQLAAEYAETRVLANDGVVDAIALDLFRKITGDQSASTAEQVYQARYYLALHLAQSGDLEGGLVAWRSLREDAPAGAIWIPMLEDQIAAAQAALSSPPPATPPAGTALDAAAPARGPTGADMAAAAQMTPAQRNEMIQGMVSGLAARLAENPGDVQGWRQLARSYAVLGRTAEQIDALERVVDLAPSDVESLIALATALDESDQKTKATGHWRKALSLLPVRDSRRSAVETRLKQL